MKKQYISLAFFALFMAAAVSASAQFLPPPQPGPTTNGQQKPANTPIDGGVVALVAAGAAYGAKKMRNRKKMQNTESSKQ